MPEAGWKKLSAEEQRLASKWYWEQGKPPSEIASLLDRDKSTLTRFLVKQVSRKKQGRPPVLSDADFNVFGAPPSSANCEVHVQVPRDGSHGQA